MTDNNVNQQLPPRAKSHNRWPRKWATLGGCGSSAAAIPKDEFDFQDQPETVDDRQRRGRSLFRKSSTVGRNQPASNSPDEISSPPLKKSNSLINVLRSKLNSPTVMRRFRSKSRENSKQIVDDQNNPSAIEKLEKDNVKSKKANDKEKIERKSRKRDPSPIQRFANRVLQFTRAPSQPRQTERRNDPSSQSPSKSRSKDSSLEQAHPTSTTLKKDDVDHINACYDEIRAKYFHSSNSNNKNLQSNENSERTEFNGIDKLSPSDDPSDDYRRKAFTLPPDDPLLHARKQANIKLNCMLSGYSLSNPFANRERVFGDHYLFKFHHYHDVAKRTDWTTSNTTNQTFDTIKTRPISRSIDSFHRTTVSPDETKLAQSDQFHIDEDQSTGQTQVPPTISNLQATKITDTIAVITRIEDLLNDKETRNTAEESPILLNTNLTDVSQSNESADRLNDESQQIQTNIDELEEKFQRAIDRVLDLVKDEQTEESSSTNPEIIITESDENELFIREDGDVIETETTADVHPEDLVETEIPQTQAIVDESHEAIVEKEILQAPTTVEVHPQVPQIEATVDVLGENIVEKEVLRTEATSDVHQEVIFEPKIPQTQKNSDVPPQAIVENTDLEATTTVEVHPEAIAEPETPQTQTNSDVPPQVFIENKDHEATTAVEALPEVIVEPEILQTQTNSDVLPQDIIENKDHEAATAVEARPEVIVEPEILQTQTNSDVLPDVIVEKEIIQTPTTIDMLPEVIIDDLSIPTDQSKEIENETSLDNNQLEKVELDLDQSGEQQTETNFRSETDDTPISISSVLNELVIIEETDKIANPTETNEESLATNQQNIEESLEKETVEITDEELERNLFNAVGRALEIVHTEENLQSSTTPIASNEPENSSKENFLKQENSVRDSESSELSDQEVERNLLEAVDRALGISKTEENLENLSKTTENENLVEQLVDQTVPSVTNDVDETNSNDSAYDEFERRLGEVLDESFEKTSDQFDLPATVDPSEALNETNVKTESVTKAETSIESSINDINSEVSIDQTDQSSENLVNQPSTINHDEEVKRSLLQAVDRALDVVNADQTTVTETIEQSNIENDRTSLDFSQITELATASIDKSLIFNNEEQIQVDKQESIVGENVGSMSQSSNIETNVNNKIEEATVDQVLTSVIENVLQRLHASRISNESVNRSSELD